MASCRAKQGAQEVGNTLMSACENVSRGLGSEGRGNLHSACTSGVAPGAGFCMIAVRASSCSIGAPPWAWPCGNPAYRIVRKRQ